MDSKVSVWRQATPFNYPTIPLSSWYTEITWKQDVLSAVVLVAWQAFEMVWQKVLFKIKHAIPPHCNLLLESYFSNWFFQVKFGYETTSPNHSWYLPRVDLLVYYTFSLLPTYPQQLTHFWKCLWTTAIHVPWIHLPWKSPNCHQTIYKNIPMWQKSGCMNEKSKMMNQNNTVYV